MTACTHVLVVDDDPAVREILSDVLRAEGYDVLCAENGKEALDTLEELQDTPDAQCLVLLDLMMPVKNGWQVLEELRSHPQLSELPVVVMSAFAERTREEQLEKPVDLDKLLSTVRRHCAVT
jgi:CheY-like chemotaxis protein